MVSLPSNGSGKLGEEKEGLKDPDEMENTKATNLLNATELETHIQPLRDCGSTHRARKDLSLMGSQHWE